MPRFGVYKSVTYLDGRVMPSVTNIGVKPTVDYKDSPLAETHIMDLTVIFTAGHCVFHCLILYVPKDVLTA